jgi:uncharacterized Tic20 family protein
MRAQREHVLSGLCHLFNAVPLWGLLYCGWMWYALREESRTVVYHARQAMTFHVVLMLGLLVYLALGFVARLLGVLLPELGGVFRQINDSILKAALLAYVAICVCGCVLCSTGRSFHYPLLGRRPAP